MNPPQVPMAAPGNAGQAQRAVTPYHQNELAVSASAAKAKALVEARYTVAFSRPRDWDQVRQDILKECSRPSFAIDKSTLYRKPIGDGVEGLGIRFVEMAISNMRNVDVDVQLAFEDEMKEVHTVVITDLERNVPWTGTAVVHKTVERSRPHDDGSFFAVRKNSYGKDVFTVRATDDDLLNKRLAQISKVIRTVGLRLIPVGIQVEAEELIRKIRADKTAQDPDAERRKVIDAFARINVRVSELTEYLGHDVGTCSPKEIDELRAIYGTISEGEATWADTLEHRRSQRTDAGAPPPPPPAAPKGAERKKGKDKDAGAPPPADKPAPPPASATPAPASPPPATKPAAAKPATPASGVMAPADPEEKDWVQTKLAALQIPLDEALLQVGLTDFNNLTADGFILLKEFINQQEAGG